MAITIRCLRRQVLEFLLEVVLLVLGVVVEIVLSLLGALVYLIPGAIVGGVFAVIAYFWPFGNAANGTLAIAIWVVFGLLVADLCHVARFPV